MWKEREHVPAKSNPSGEAIYWKKGLNLKKKKHVSLIEIRDSGFPVKNRDAGGGENFPK